MYNLRPTVLVRTLDPKAIVDVLRFVADEGTPLAIRGGGHHIAGFGSCDSGVVLDFSPFRRVTVDSSTGLVSVQPGAQLRDLDGLLASLDRVVPSGTVSTTGIAGLTLGGGIGWLVGKYGLTCDHLDGADLVLANGERVHTEDGGHEDLIWALRGGGGNFGVVTEFRFRSRLLPAFITGSAVVPWSNAARSLSDSLAYLDEGCSPSLTVAPTLSCVRGRPPSLSIDFCLCGTDDRELRALESAVGPADWRVCHDADYVAWQRTFDSLFEPPMRGFWKASYGSRPHGGALVGLLEAMVHATTERATIIFEHLHGAIAVRNEEYSAFPLRRKDFGVLISARWAAPEEDEASLSWVRDTFDVVDPSGITAAYGNYTAREDSRPVRLVDDRIAMRLAAAKAKYDPTNLFRRNHNILPRPSLESSATGLLRQGKSIA